MWNVSGAVNARLSTRSSTPPGPGRKFGASLTPMSRLMALMVRSPTKPAGGSNTGAPAIFPTACPVDGNTPAYNLTISAATASTYTLQAAPTGGQAGDECGNLTLTNTGVKSVSSAASGVTWDECW